MVVYRIIDIPQKAALADRNKSYHCLKALNNTKLTLFFLFKIYVFILHIHSPLIFTRVRYYTIILVGTGREPSEIVNNEGYLVVAQWQKWWKIRNTGGRSGMMADDGGWSALIVKRCIIGFIDI